MKTQEQPKAKSPTSRPVPTAAEQAAAFALLSQKDRDSFERQITNAETKGGANLSGMWRRLAGVALALAPKTPKLSGVNTIQFFIPDGKHRKQVMAMHLSDTGTIIVYVSNIVAEAVKAKLVTAVVKSPTPDTYVVGKGTDQIVIEALDRDTLNPQFYFKDMTGWNRKAMAINLPATATPAMVQVAEQLIALTATWPAEVPPAV